MNICGLDAQLLPIRLDMCQDATNRFDCVGFHIQQPTSHIFAVLRQEFYQIGRSGDRWHRVDVCIEAQSQGEYGINRSLLLHIFRSYSGNRCRIYSDLERVMMKLTTYHRGQI